MDLTLFLIMVIVGSIAGWIGMRISRSLKNRNSLKEDSDDQFTTKH